MWIRLPAEAIRTVGSESWRPVLSGEMRDFCCSLPSARAAMSRGEAATGLEVSFRAPVRALSPWRPPGHAQHPRTEGSGCRARSAGIQNCTGITESEESFDGADTNMLIGVSQ